MAFSSFGIDISYLIILTSCKFLAFFWYFNTER